MPSTTTEQSYSNLLILLVVVILMIYLASNTPNVVERLRERLERAVVTSSNPR